MTGELNDSQTKIQSANQNLKTTNIKLERRRQYIATILEHIGAGVLSINKAGHITTFNKAAEKISWSSKYYRHDIGKKGLSYL